MSQVDRNNPRRGTASESTYSIMEFIGEFPDDKTCLDWLWRRRYSEDGEHAHCSKCGQARKFHRVKSRPSYSCDHCGLHIHPTAGTIFHRSATSLHLWFYAMYLMTSTRCAVSAKHLERELGVTYKTAWRMANLIRNVLMDQQGEPPLSGDVEADETFFGGKPRLADKAKARRQSSTETRGDDDRPRACWRLGPETGSRSVVVGREASPENLVRARSGRTVETNHRGAEYLTPCLCLACAARHDEPEHAPPQRVESVPDALKGCTAWGNRRDTS